MTITEPTTTDAPPAWATDPTAPPLSIAFTEHGDPAELYGAIVEAFGALSNVATDQQATVPTKTGGSYSYKYMSLGAIMAAVRGPLSSAGLAIIQGPSIERDGNVRSVEISTRLLHKSGAWIETRIGIAVSQGADAQAIGSAMTYARRYGVTALLGIASGDDDDGQQASSAPPGDYEKPAAATMTIENAKGYILEQLDGDKALALRFWSEFFGDRPGPFVPTSVSNIAKNIPAWREQQTVDVNDDLAAASEKGDEAAVEAPVAPDQDAGGVTPPDAPSRAPGAPGGESDGSGEVGRGERARRAIHDVHLEAAIAEVKAMAPAAVRTALGEQMLDVTGNADTVRARLATHLANERTKAWEAGVGRLVDPTDQ